MGDAKKGNVTIYLPMEVLARCLAAATEDRRSLSNYIAGLLERAHPPAVHASHQVDLEDAISAVVKRGPVKVRKPK
jgi:sirohydrochlorin ferrochelatase